MLQKSTKIITTVSDRRCGVDFIRSLFEAGMNVVRMNSAHLGEEGITSIVRNCREVSPRIGIKRASFRPCLKIGGMPNGERFFRQSRQIFAGGLTPGKKI